MDVLILCVITHKTFQRFTHKIKSIQVLFLSICYFLQLLSENLFKFQSVILFSNEFHNWE